jgi:hypothetical protein
LAQAAVEPVASPSCDCEQPQQIAQIDKTTIEATRMLATGLDREHIGAERFRSLR